MTFVRRRAYRKSIAILNRMKLYWSVNWTKTVYFNFKMFPFKTAVKLPVIFYGKVSFGDLSGKVILKEPITRGQVGFGQRFEMARESKGIAEFSVAGRLVFNGPAHIAKDVFLFVAKDAYCEFGYMSALGSDVKLICANKIVLGDWTGIGYESQLIDTNAHPMKNSKTGKHYPMTAPILLGSHNAVSNRVSFMPGTVTPDFCVVASNSLCNKDYTFLGNNFLLGGIPAKLIKTEYTRDWDYEKPLLKQYKIIW